MNVIEQLIRFRRDALALETDINRLEAMTERAAAAKTSYREYETHGVGAPTDPTGIAAARIADFDRELRQRIELQTEKRRILERIITKALPPVLAAVIKIYYIDARSMADATTIIFGAEPTFDSEIDNFTRRTYRRRRAALDILREQGDEK